MCLCDFLISPFLLPFDHDGGSLVVFLPTNWHACNTKYDIISTYILLQHFQTVWENQLFSRNKVTFPSARPGLMEAAGKASLNQQTLLWSPEEPPKLRETKSLYRLKSRLFGTCECCMFMYDTSRDISARWRKNSYLNQLSSNFHYRRQSSWEYLSKAYGKALL